MPSLTERLKSLGVKVGAKDLPPPRRRSTHPIDEVVPGRLLDTPGGTAYLVEANYPSSYYQGQVGLRIANSPYTIAEWAGNIEIANQAPESYAFLDTETSGLAGGTGTFAFLVGVGRYTQEGFYLGQFFMRDPLEEPALLLALEEFLAPCQTVVTFNGKSFDVPLLNTRYILQGWKSPFQELAQVDLLHLSRRLWRDRLPSRTLGNLEAQILRANRTDEEIPGWMIPQIYFDYLREGDARPLKRVFYHNAMDVVSLAALLTHTSSLLEDPLNQSKDESSDLAAIARLFEDLGHPEKATDLYKFCLNAELPENSYLDALYHLSLLYKHHANFQAAIPLWEIAASQRQLYAYEELAKYFEHHTIELETALKWTKAALELLNTPGFSPAEQYQALPEFQHRLQRLQRKIASHGK